MQNIRICEMPNCKMVSSGTGMFGDETFTRFDEWFSSQKRGMFPKDFLYWDGEGFNWLYFYEDGMEVPAGFDVIGFRGGLYAIATGIDQKTDMDAMNAEVDSFLKESGFERDSSRPQLGNVITPPIAREVMGYEQMNYYFPIQSKE